MPFTVIKKYPKISTHKKLMLFKKHLEYNYMSQLHSKDKIKLKDYYNIFQKVQPKVTSNYLQKTLINTYKKLKPKTGKPKKISRQTLKAF